MDPAIEKQESTESTQESQSKQKTRSVPDTTFPNDVSKERNAADRRDSHAPDFNLQTSHAKAGRTRSSTPGAQRGPFLSESASQSPEEFERKKNDLIRQFTRRMLDGAENLLKKSNSRIDDILAEEDPAAPNSGKPPNRDR